MPFGCRPECGKASPGRLNIICRGRLVTSSVLKNRRCASTTRSISLLSCLRKQTNTPQPYSGIRSKSAVFPVGSMIKTFGHPHFLAFVSRQLLLLAQGHFSEPKRFWPAIFKRLEQEKIRSDLAHVTEREVQLLREVANAASDEIGPRELSNLYERKYLKPPYRKGPSSSRGSRSLQTLSPTLSVFSKTRMKYTHAHDQR